MDPASDPDPWLVRWLPLLRERSRGLPVLELGCGAGRDSQVLHSAGLSVIGIDSSPSQVEAARATLPGAEFHTLDVRDPFPVPAGLGVVVASLVLHYFSWSETIAIAGRLHRTLRDGGVLLVRVNSTQDHEYGAIGHPRLDENYYLVGGQPKRFFDRTALANLFADGWRPLHLEERIIQRYARPKTVWEGLFERHPSTGHGSPCP